jgi:hypothetical protein
MDLTEPQNILIASILAKPFIVLLFMGLLLCVRYAVIKYFPDCFIKRLLLIRLYHPRRSRTDSSTTPP